MTGRAQDDADELPADRPRGGGRALTARSVVASTLLGVDPPELPTRSLVATAHLLGVSPGTARVAISRMVANGELVATDDGYRLAGRPLLARQARQALSRKGPGADWDGRWRLAVATAEPRSASARAELRAATASLRFAALRDGVWLRPDNLPVELPPEPEAVLRGACTLLRSEPDEPRRLAAQLWDLTAWSARATELLGELENLDRRLDREGAGTLAEGFVTSAAVLRHLQDDPLLPGPLLPGDWPGAELRATHRRYDAAFKAVLAGWQRREGP